MAFFALAFRFAFRKRLRSLITALGVGVTLLAFLLLQTLIAGWYTVERKQSETERMIIRHKVAITFPLFTPQADKIREVPGVLEVSWLCWFGAVYIDAKNSFPQLAVDSASYFRMYPEYLPPPEQMADFMGDPTGALVGRDLAKRFGWKVGDRVMLKGTYYAGDWDFTIRAIYPGADDETSREFFFLHWKYLNEKLPGGNHVQRLLALVNDARVAKDIDALFAASQTPTKTETETAVEQYWSTWGSSVVAVIHSASAVILLVMMLVLGNGMAMATRESTREYAAMRAIGYRSGHIVRLVLVEGCLIALLGCAAGLLAAPTVVTAFSKLLEDRLGGSYELELDPLVTAAAVVVALVASMSATAWPAWRSGHLRIVDALRRVA